MSYQQSNLKTTINNNPKVSFNEYLTNSFETDYQEDLNDLKFELSGQSAKYYNLIRKRIRHNARKLRGLRD